MSKICDICGKKLMFLNQVSHAKNASRRSALPNLRSVKGKKVCAKCLKAGKAK